MGKRSVLAIVMFFFGALQPLSAHQDMPPLSGERAQETLFAVDADSDTALEKPTTKIYVTHEQLKDQIEFTDTDILFYALESGLPYLVSSIAYNEKGVYVMLSDCKHRPKCRHCGGCYYFKNCPNNCTCIKACP